MKHTKKLLSVLLAALLLTGCFTLAFSASAAGDAPQAYGKDNLVLLKYDTDDLQDGDWYFDSAAVIEYVKTHPLENETEAEAVARGEAFLYDTMLFFDTNTEVFYIYYTDFGMWDVLNYGDDGYDVYRDFIKQYQSSAPTDPGTPAPSDPGTPAPTASVCPWCGGRHEGGLQGIVGFFHKILASIFGAKY